MKFPTWAEVPWQPPKVSSNPGCGLDQLASIRDAHFPCLLFRVVPGWCHLLCELWDADTSWITLMLCINLASWRNQSITLIECSALVPGGCLESRKLDHIWSALTSNKEKNYCWTLFISFFHMQKFKIKCWATASLMCVLCSGLNLGWIFSLFYIVHISKEEFHLCQLPALITCPDFSVHWTAGTKTSIQIFVHQLNPFWWKEHLGQKEEPWAWTLL